MNKKSQLIDMVYVLVILFIVSIGFVVALYVVTAFNTQIAGDFSTEAKAVITDSENTWTYANWIYPVLIIGIIIAIAVTYLYIPQHPVMIFIEFIVLFFVVVFGNALSTVNQELMNSTELNASAQTFSTMNLVNSNFAPLAVIIGLIVLLVLFLKRGERD